jgi:AcrR family transcriptional regulator
MKEITIKLPRQARSRAKFNVILAASARVLEEYGYAKTTTGRIALEADVSIGTLYDYFSCKEAIFVAYLDNELNNALENVAKEVSQHSCGTTEALSKLIRIGVDFAHTHRVIIKVMFTELSYLLDKISFILSKDRIAQLAVQFAQDQEIKLHDKSIDLMTYALTNIVIGFQFRIVALPDERFDATEITKEMTEIITRYLLK